MHIALISPPWPLFNRPSLQLATLKAFLAKNRPDLNITCHHPYLQIAATIGFEAYHTISESSWASEAICSPLLFSGMEKSSNALFFKALGHDAKKNKLPIKIIRKQVKRILEDLINSLPLERLNLIGITVSINQLTAALFLAKLIKSKMPELPIVLGGASVSDKAGEWVFNTFQTIDYLVDGEGELPLLGLIDFLRKLKTHPPTAVRFRGKIEAPQKEQLDSIEQIPPPDFSDYFQELAILPPGQRFFPVLPIEASRGCWWGRCNFCNLNLQWKGYRAKSPQRISKEVDWLARRHGVIDFAFMDNALPKNTAAECFRELSSHKRDYSFFAELRASHSREEWAEMSKGGLCEVQIGIEALSASLLKRLGKGTNLIHNIAAMRNAEEFDVELNGNLILHFPGSTHQEVQETLQVLEFVWPFRPLKTVSFWLGLHSPVALNPHLFHIKNIKPHENWYNLFPKEMLRHAEPLILRYTGDRLQQKRLWKPVEQWVNSWHVQRKKISSPKPLTYRDGGDFLHIRQELPNGKILTHRLYGLSREIYLFCLEPTAIAAVCSHFPQKTPVEIQKFIQDLVSKRLMFEHENQILSLAIRAKH